MWSIVGLARLENDGVIQLGRGRVISKKDMQAFEGPYPVYSAAKTGEGRFGTYGKYDFDEELITWSVDGGGRLFHRERHKFSITNVTGFLRILNPQVLTYRFLYYALTHLHSNIGFDWVKKAHPSVLRKEYTSIPLPPLAEQKRIVERLDKAFGEIDKAIATAEAKEGEIERLKAATLSAMLNRESQSGESITEDEEDSVMWKTVRLGEVLRTGAGGTPLKSNKSFYDDGEIKWLLSGAVCEKDIYDSQTHITEAGLANSSAKLFPQNTVLVAMYGATAGQVGILRTEAATNQAVCGIYPSDDYLPEFIYYYLTNFKETLLEEVSGVAQPNLSQVKIKNIPVPVISLAEQKRIVERLDKAFGEIESVSAKTQSSVENYAALKAVVLKQELTPSEAV